MVDINPLKTLALLLGLAYQCKDKDIIVFRFIIEYIVAEGILAPL
jgi:hypothetical protein